MNRPESVACPLVSVIVPTYNRANYICETIESILAQDYPEKEILVIDDGSSDDTASVLKQYGDRIRYFYHPNQGEAITVNRGWSLATGEYAAIVSSDDPVRPGWLSACVEFMQNRPAVLVGYPDWIMINDAGAEIEKVEVFDYSQERLLGWWHCLPGPGAIIRRGALSDIVNLREPGCRYVSDMETWTRLSLRGDFSRIPGYWASWRRHDGAATVSASALTRAKEVIQFAEKFFAREDLPAHVQELRAMGLSRAYAFSSRIVLSVAPIQSWRYYRHSLKLCNADPAGLPAYLRRRGFFSDALLGLKRRLSRNK